ncbi:tail fiber domain-containing protein [Mesorhizobium sp. M2D.F.Ca.ET.223.01.1.1]|uniref:tail fiber domain-containing protein n=1 Tax=Mesorhizobium sp. M2D.F.Ca.ET.223.01.1.1 TaxID=2563940 RepID=UPI001091E4F8|nr:tail fiber domain-containing protein [Mesorhizobium sp. M2D.F.Ca.ET.223.01.1.1]TGR84575.1 tail fiber domain-containing protein [Mesorhizobium sp. M2D.F.Ca.ET.223.01.1.1]TGT75167.1 tail fiber domain-containing protein [bacterium M00.F.Ca.ET.159.01.1.1]TGT88034.1 tail fiber domain-containing protein [bacterium M00.F.Ca.ET.157.01.1.1]
MGKSAPKPPDPKETSAASTSTNVGTAIANAFMGNVNQNTPDGSLNYSQTGTYKWNDPYTGKSYDIPTFTATQTLSPTGQAIKDQTDAAQLNLGKIANSQSAFLNDYLGKPVDLSSDNVSKYIDTHFMDDFNKTWDQNQSGLESQLANKGINIGSDAYTRAMGDFSTQRANARDNLYGNQYGQAQQSIMAERNQPINEISALLNGSQVSQPSFVNTNMPTIPTTDVAGLINTNYQQKLAAYQQQQAQTGGILGGLFGLGSAFLGNPALSFSDRRLKTDVKKIGKTTDGQNIYAYRYKGDNRPQIGLMAQEVERKHPGAVVEIGGFKAVDYSKALGTTFGLGKAA